MERGELADETPPGAAATRQGDSRHREDERTHGRPWLTLVATMLGIAMVALDGTATTIALPHISDSVSATLGQLEFVATVYLIALAAGLVPAGLLAERIGRRKVFIAGALGFGLASVGAALSGSIVMLLAFRIVQGVAGATLAPAALALLRHALPARRLGVPLGIWGGVNLLAIAVGPVIAGVLVQGLSWPAVFWLNVPLVAIMIVLTVVGVAESKGPTRVSPAMVGNLLRNRSLGLGALLVGFSSFGVFGLLFVLTLFLKNVRGLEPTSAGFWMLAPTCVVLVSALVGGLLAQRVGPRWPVVIGLALVTAGLCGLTFLEPGAQFRDLAYPGALVGSGTGLAVVAASQVMLAVNPKEWTGLAATVQQAASQLGGVIGIAAAGGAMSWQVAERLPARLTQAGLPEPAAGSVRAGIDAISQGNTPVGFAGGGVGEPLANAARVISQLSFTDAMGITLLGAAGVSVLGSIVAFWLPRPVARSADG